MPSEPPPPSTRATDWAAAVMEKLAERRTGATICPSEVARAQIEGDWRAAMPDVHAAVAGLVEAGRVTLSWKGSPRAVGDGPYRIALATKETPAPDGPERALD